MSYIKNNLMANEKIILSARIHRAVFLPSILAFIFGIAAMVKAVGMTDQQSASSAYPGLVMLFGILFFLFAIKLGLDALIVILTTEFAITNRRIVAKTGFIRRHTLEMLLPKVESVAVSQDILGRLLNFGTVTVTGTGGTKESFKAIVNPIDVRKKINQIIEHYMQASAQQQRGILQPNSIPLP